MTDTSTDAQLIAELRRLDESRTPGEWIADEGDGTEHYKSDEAKIMVWADADCDAHPIADCSANHTCRLEDEAEANAAFIAAIPNALPRLLSLAESALTARTDALREAAEIARYGLLTRNLSYDTAEEIKRAILARIQEKNDD